MLYQQPRTAVLVCILLAAVWAAGCSKSPQAEYKDALAHLSDRKEAVQKARDKVDDAQHKVDAAKDKLKQAENRLKRAQGQVEEARKQVNKRVSDDVLFRTLQKKMLDNDAFSDAAISVTVKNRVVTLVGNVPDKQTRKKAVQIAQDQAGVARVNNQLEISGKQDAATAKKQDDQGS